MKEIGSEFWEQGKIEEPYCENTAYVLSGRTALDFVIRDIKAVQCLSTVFMPSYCCESMIEPFLKNGVNVEFYDLDSADIFDCVTFEAILLIDFFGFIDKRIDIIAKQLKQKGKIIIYDATHYLGKRNIELDYSFCSYRKWCFANFAEVHKNSKFNISVPTKSNELYVKTRNKAALAKRGYMEGKYSDKAVFLDLYQKAEELLEADYIAYKGTVSAINKEFIVECRRKNALRLIDGIKDINELKLWRDKVGSYDTPLFVPILLDPALRNELRTFLISNNVYCPIHWPITDLHKCTNNYYDIELSLICDQRYSADDIDKEIYLINRFFEERYSKCH